MAAVAQRSSGSLLKFFSLTYAVTWPCFIAAAALPVGALRAVLLILGTFAPSLVALWLTARTDAATGTRAMLKRLVEWRGSARWDAFVLGYMVVIKLAGAIVHRGGTVAWPRFGNEAWYA